MTLDEWLQDGWTWGGWRGRTYGYDGKRWAAYFHRSGWAHISLGVHVSLEDPNLELHVPFGFFRFGRASRLTVDMMPGDHVLLSIPKAVLKQMEEGERERG